LARILIADDDPMILRLLEASLGAAGHDIATAVDGREVLETIEDTKPDIVILDSMMPEVSGLEVLKVLKANETLMHLPVILMTARAEEEDIAEGLQLGAKEYLVKPFPPKDLVAVIDRLAG